MTSVAACKIKMFRLRSYLSRRAFGEHHAGGASMQTVYGWEVLEKHASPDFVRALDAAGVCAPGDWYEAADAELLQQVAQIEAQRAEPEGAAA